jgi:hypothetical protein
LEEGAAPTRRVETSGKRLVTFEAVIEVVVVVVDIFNVGEALRPWFNWTRLSGFACRNPKRRAHKLVKEKMQFRNLQTRCEGVSCSLLHDWT